MFAWFKRKEETPAVVAKASQLEYEIRDQLVLAEAKVAYKDLTELAISNPQYPDIRRLQANAALNLLRMRPDGRTAEDEVLRDGVQQLAGLHPTEGILRECLVHLNWEYMSELPTDRIDECAAIHSKQLELYASYPEVREHADPVIRSTMKLMTDYLILGDIENAQPLYEKVESLADEHLDDREVQILRGSSALNLIQRLATVDDMGPNEMELARDYYQALEKFVRGYRFKEDLAEFVTATAAMVDE